MELKNIKKKYISKISNIIKKNKYKEVFKNILYYPIEVIGESSFCEVVKVGNLEGETAVMKIMENGSIQEYEIGLLAGNRSIGPRHYSYMKIQNNYSCILMEEIKGIQLNELYVTPDILNKIFDIYYLLYTRHGIIHNDLKSQNIIYTYENEIKLIDYGESQTESNGFDIENNMIKMASLLINSLTFEYNKYNNTGKENLFFNTTNKKENNTFYFLEIYTATISWLISTFKKKIILDIKYDMFYVDIKIINQKNPEIPIYKLENAIPPAVLPKSKPILYRRRPHLSHEHFFIKKNLFN